MIQRNKLTAEMQFLNVDLEIGSKEDLIPLAAALGSRVSVLSSYRWRGLRWIGLEIIPFRPLAWKTPSAVIRAFVKQLDGLAGRARKSWVGAEVRDFNVGIEAGLKPNSAVYTLDADVVKAVARLGGRIVFTVYSPALREQGKRRRK